MQDLSLDLRRRAAYAAEKQRPKEVENIKGANSHRQKQQQRFIRAIENIFWLSVGMGKIQTNYESIHVDLEFDRHQDIHSSSYMCACCICVHVVSKTIRHASRNAPPGGVDSYPRCTQSFAKVLFLGDCSAQMHGACLGTS
jgi:hypothetical protein